MKVSNLVIYVQNTKPTAMTFFNCKSFIIITYIISYARSEEVSGVTLTSSCDILPGGTGPWTKGSGPIIHSWLQVEFI